MIIRPAAARKRLIPRAAKTDKEKQLAEATSEEKAYEAGAKQEDEEAKASQKRDEEHTKAQAELDKKITEAQAKRDKDSLEANKKEVEEWDKVHESLLSPAEKYEAILNKLAAQDMAMKAAGQAGLSDEEWTRAIQKAQAELNKTEKTPEFHAEVARSAFGIASNPEKEADAKAQLQSVKNMENIFLQFYNKYILGGTTGAILDFVGAAFDTQ